MWDVDQYSKFSDERSRPFRDLLAQVSVENPRLIVDLGCGTGSLTRSLAERWSEARVLGVDSSPEMLGKAAPLAIPNRLEFLRTEIDAWSPAEPIDLIVSNAALHWIGNHETLFSRLVAMLAPGGTLAVQMPDRFGTPSQRAIEESVADPRWSATLRGVGLHRGSVRPVAWYAQLLYGLGLKLNAWETTYIHVLSGENPVLEWLKGTALRPLADRLEPSLAAEFLSDVASRLIAAYPSTGDITLFPMPRLFFVATKSRSARAPTSSP